jgi:hypothetical protein
VKFWFFRYLRRFQGRQELSEATVGALTQEIQESEGCGAGMKGENSGHREGSLLAHGVRHVPVFCYLEGEKCSWSMDICREETK